jgi:hypothetical protein
MATELFEKKRYTGITTLIAQVCEPRLLGRPSSRLTLATGNQPMAPTKARQK